MYYIYCYTNRINQHKYVGQTNNMQRRIREHRSCAENPNASSYNDLIHKKIREYKEENFSIDILEKLYTVDQKEADAREQYWIKKLNSHCSTGQGYNMTWGGSSAEHRRAFPPETIQEIKQQIKDGITFLDLCGKYNVSPSFLSSLNHGVYYFDENETYPLCKYYKDDSDYDELIDLLLNSSYTLSDIAKMLGIGYSTVKKINAGTLRPGMYPSYPIRKETAYAQRANNIKNLLLTTNYSTQEIANMLNVSDSTVQRIRNGEVFYDSKLKYPLKPVTTIPSEIGSTSPIGTEREMGVLIKDK